MGPSTRRTMGGPFKMAFSFTRMRVLTYKYAPNNLLYISFIVKKNQNQQPNIIYFTFNKWKFLSLSSRSTDCGTLIAVLRAMLFIYYTNESLRHTLHTYIDWDRSCCIYLFIFLAQTCG